MRDLSHNVRHSYFQSTSALLQTSSTLSGACYKAYCKCLTLSNLQVFLFEMN